MSDFSALVVFTLFVLAILGFELRTLRHRADSAALRTAGLWLAVWFALAAAVNLGFLFRRGAQPALEFLACYLLEGSLSFDNAFVFAAIFSAASVPATHRHKALLWGVLGALVMRGLLVFAGVELISHFHPMLYIFGAILIVAGVRLARGKRAEFDFGHSRMVRLLRRVVSMTESYEGGWLWVRRDGRWMATPLLMVVILVEAADLAFAMDSIPAAFGVTRDPLVLYTSNILAVMGLRAMYLILSEAIGRLRYLRAGLAIILVFVGTKILLEPYYRLPIVATLAVLFAILGAAVLASTRN